MVCNGIMKNINKDQIIEQSDHIINFKKMSVISMLNQYSI